MMLSQYAASAQTESSTREHIHASAAQQSASFQHSSGPGASTTANQANSRHHPYKQRDSTIALTQQDTGGDVNGNRRDFGVVRRRITRACDHCHQLRTKCDGEAPCSHCIESGLICEYNRQRKKRGKASRKLIAQADETTAASGPARSSQDQSSEAPSPTQAASAFVSQYQDNRGLTPQDRPNTNGARPIDQVNHGEYQKTGLGDSVIHERHIGDRSLPKALHPDLDFSKTQQKLPQIDTGPAFPRENSITTPSAISLNAFSLSHLHDRSSTFGSKPTEARSAHSGSITSQTSGQQANLPGFSPRNGESFVAASPRASQAPSPGFRFGSMGASPFPSFFNPASLLAGSPAWLNLPSPSTFQHNANQANSSRSLRYPVLQPLIPYIEAIIPISLACDLLELYFTSSSTTYLHPSSPYVLGYMFRKHSFLKTFKPRPCSPALLASMLWLAAQTSDSSFLTSSPSARGRVCQKLMEITVTLLRPLMHGPQTAETSAEGATKSMVNGVALGGLGVSMSGGEQLTAESRGTGPLDIIATYIHLATIVSASEYKAASMRWWNAAWSFAREIRLNRELPGNALDPEYPQDIDRGVNASVAGGFGTTNPLETGANPPHPLSDFANEEQREERRRVWWLLFFMDRHLSLCYNQPLTLLDAECENLIQPLTENDWQDGNWASNSPEFRPRGPRLLCTGHGVFGFFMPLMTILGEIVDLNHARAHPRNGQRSTSRTVDWDERETDIRSRLEAYARSLTEFELQANATTDRANALDPSIQAQTPGGRKMSDAAIQTKTVVAYGTHIMQVLHILATGKWDPINLLDDNDLWISSPSFISAMGHAVSAADAVADILEYDPDLSYMPWLFGISLLQGSFLFLLIADKLGSEADATVITACEKIVRAHEVCVVTLNTEYQRHMRKVMRSALTQVKGRIPADIGEQQARRREVLSLYRWTGDGTGIAL